MFRLIIFLGSLLCTSAVLRAQVEAIFVENRVEITWTYTECSQLSHFVIEKSKNGISFKEFLRVQNGKCCSSFLEIDYSPFKSKTYYRIRYVNKSGSNFFSETVTVKKYSPVKQLISKLKGYHSLNTLVVLKDKSNGEFYAKLNIQEVDGKLISETLNENIRDGEFIIIASENDHLIGNILTIINQNPDK